MRRGQSIQMIFMSILCGSEMYPVLAGDAAKNLNSMHPKINSRVKENVNAMWATCRGASRPSFVYNLKLQLSAAIAKEAKDISTCKDCARAKKDGGAHLVARVTTVDEAVGASHELGGVRGEEDAEAVELVNATETVLGGQGLPDLLLGLEGGDTVEGGVHVTGGDAVDTDVVLGPLSGDGLGVLDDTGLGGVVAGLFLGVVDDAAGHGGNEDEAARLAGGHHGTTNGLGHEEGSRKVDVNETTEHGRVVGLSLDVGVGNTSSIDEDVRNAKVLDNRLDSGIDGATVTNVNLEEGDGETRLLVQLSSGDITKILVGVKDDDSFGTGLSAGASHVVAEATGATGDDDNLAEDGHVLEGLGHGLVDLLGQGLDDLVIGRGHGAVVGHLGGSLGDADGAVLALAGAIDGDGDLLLADDALLVLGVGDEVGAGDGECTGASRLGDGEAGGRSGSSR